MPFSEVHRGVIRFGVFEVDLPAGRIRRNGLRVHLQDQPFRVLAMLLERPGEVVTREDLRARLWPSDTFVDFDHGLNAAVKRLRDALGDSAENPRFVETLARRGYRFLAPVELPGKAPPAGQTSVIAGLRWRFLAVGFLVVISAIGFGLHLGMRVSRALQPALPKEIRLTANSPDVPVYFAALSPDGRYLAYIDPRGTFLREIGTDEAHALPLPEGFRVHHLSWYPDGTHLLAEAVAGQEQRPSLWNISVLGGAARKLVAGAEAGSVSPDGKQVAFLRGDKFDHSEIWLADTDGGGPQVAVEVPGFVVGPPAWSPDSRRFAYLQDVYWPGCATEDLRIEVYELAGRKSEVLLSDYRLQYGLVWTRNNRILFSRAEEPPNQGQSNVWSLEVDRRPGWPGGAPVRLTSGPDLKPVLNMSADARPTETSSQNSGVPARRATNSQPEGEFQSTNVRLMRIPLDGGVSLLLLEDSGINNFQCARLPSRECLYSKYTKDALVFEEFDAKTGTKKELLRTSEPGWQSFNWSLSPDGRTVALAKKMRAAEEAEIRLVPTGGGAPRVLKVKDWGRISTLDWAANGKSFWASATLHGETRALINIDLEGRAKPVLEESKPYVGWAIPSQDGKRLAIWEATGGSNAWMLEVPPAW